MRPSLPLAFAAGVAAFGALAAGARPAAAEPPVPSTDGRELLGMQLYGRGLFLPGALLGGLFPQHTELNSGSFGASFVRRKGPFDVVVSLDVGFYGLNAGNFLAEGKDPKVDTHFTDFRNFTILSADVSLYWTRDLSRNVAFTIGGGFGLGYIFGDIWVVNNAGRVCTADNAGDEAACYPFVDPAQYARFGNPAPTYTSGGKEVPLSGAIKPDDPEFEAKLDGLRRSQEACLATGKGDCRDTAEHPYWRKAEKIPVAPVINFQLGLKFKINRHFHWNLMGGFRNGFVVGGGPEFVF